MDEKNIPVMEEMTPENGKEVVYTEVIEPEGGEEDGSTSEM